MKEYVGQSLTEQYPRGRRVQTTGADDRSNIVLYNFYSKYVKIIEIHN